MYTRVVSTRAATWPRRCDGVTRDYILSVPPLRPSVGSVFYTDEPHMRLGAPLAHHALASAACSALLAASLSTTPLPVHAVSGGGKDYSGYSLEGQDFSGKNLAGKEFRGIRGAGAIFKGANLGGTSFFKADLSNADMSSADLTSASLEEAGLDGVLFTGAVLESSYLTGSITTAKDIKGADFSEAVMPAYTQKQLCSREDATGTNPKTGVDTRDSLMCR